IFPSTNLQKLAIEFEGPSPGKQSEEPSFAIISLVRSAQNIESLHLDFSRAEDKRGWGAAEFFSSLSSDDFPNLRNLWVKSSSLTMINSFGGPELHRFIENHNQLQELTIAPTRYDRDATVTGPPGTTTLRNMEGLMPSLRCFRGTTPNLNLLLKSGTARQLEALGFLLYPGEHLEVGEAELPCLKRLRIRAIGLQYWASIDWATILGILGKLASRTPTLQELSVDVTSYRGKAFVMENLPELLRVLGQLLDLRQLTIMHASASWLPSQGVDKHIAKEFPLLKVVIIHELGSSE
ncbi:hypothetical protein FRC11_003515, partial [Ceratobasidium sp. 423]